MIKTILVVEDSPITRSLIVSSLEDMGNLRVVEAESGFEALRKLPEFTPDLLITDINMPDINGLELIRFAKQNENYRHIPIIIVTTEGREVDRERGLGLGADSYIVKPFVPETLQEQVSKLLG